MVHFATPEDVARAVAFLADPDWSGFVNGNTLSVDGGWFGDGSWEGLRRGKHGLYDTARTEIERARESPRE
jgi:NAD(P)-dependent dehydrogenase (short-subunit alcohol dehydrogenase family)